MKTLGVAVHDQSQVAEARREAARLAAEVPFNETDTGRAALVATEAATNLIRHAGGGDVLISMRCEEPAAIEILALDKGPGIADLERGLRDGYSTAGGPGTGLGAMLRLSSEFRVYSPPGRGAAVLSRIWPGNRRPPARLVEFGGVAVPMRGERVCGDAWSVEPLPGGGLTVMVADGLGHGPQAAEASAEAVRVFREHARLADADLIDYLDRALRPTRGAAIAIARLLPGAREVRFAGVGNIGGMIHGERGSRQMISHAGTVGHSVRKVHQFTYPWPPGAVVLLYSDGINSHLSFEGYPGLAASDPSLMAGLFFRDFNRGRDDATVVALRERLP